MQQSNWSECYNHGTIIVDTLLLSASIKLFLTNAMYVYYCCIDTVNPESKLRIDMSYLWIIN